jgi:hypothetical protein
MIETGASSRRYRSPDSELSARRPEGDDGGMLTATRLQRIYDHRLKELVNETGDIHLAVRRGVPRSTARGWLGRSHENVVTLDVFRSSGKQLREEVVALRRRNRMLRAVLGILVAVLRTSNFSPAVCHDLRDFRGRYSGTSVRRYPFEALKSHKPASTQP